MAERKEDMIIISDFHMGDCGPRDNFKGKEQAFFDFTDYVKSTKEEVLFIGDLLDLWQVNLGSILNARRPILDRLVELNATYITGNHDIDLEPIIGQNALTHPIFQKMSKPFTRTINGKVFKFMHGHETDPFNNQMNPDWGRILSVLAGICEDDNGGPVSKNGQYVEIRMQNLGENIMTIWYYLNKIFHPIQSRKMKHPHTFRTPRQRKDKDLMLSQHINSMFQNKQEEGYDMLIVGHTHYPGTFSDWYVNSGSWSEGYNSFIQIDELGNSKVFDWKNGKPNELDIDLSSRVVLNCAAKK